MFIRFVLWIVFLFCASDKLTGQGNLQFSQVITLINGQNYTVPAGAVFKVESMNQFFSGTINLTYSSCVINAPSIGVNSGVTCYYNPLTYLQVGGISLNKGSGEFTYVNSGGSCTVCPATKTISATLPTVNLPIWLSAGEQVSLKVAGAQISGIEFLVIQ